MALIGFILTTFRAAEHNENVDDYVLRSLVTVFDNTNNQQPLPEQEMRTTVSVNDNAQAIEVKLRDGLIAMAANAGLTITANQVFQNSIRRG